MYKRQVKSLAEEKDSEVSRVTADTEQRIQKLEESAAATAAELEQTCAALRTERDAVVKEREEMEKRLAGEMGEGLRAAAEAAETAAEEARVAAKEAEAAHASELQAARETMLQEKIAAVEAAEARVRAEEQALRETSLAEVEAAHNAALEGVQCDSTGKLTEVQNELEKMKQAHEQEKAAAQVRRPVFSGIAQCRVYEVVDFGISCVLASP